MTTKKSSSRPTPKRDLWLIWAAALGLRLFYLWMALSQFGFDSLTTFAADTKLYISIADHFLTGTGDVADALLKGGPGYGLMLAGIKLIFGDNLIWPTLLNILLGSLAPVAIYLLAYKLTFSRATAIIAGIISCISLTSLSLSNSILTDQPYFTFQAFALVSFVQGFRSGKTRWFLLAGLIAGWAAYVRSAGEFWPWLFLLTVLIVPRQQVFGSRGQMIRRAALTTIVMLIFTLSWSARNYTEHGLFTFNTNGMFALRGYLLNHAVCRNTPGCVWKDQGLAWSIEDGDKTQPPAVSYANARARVLRIINEHPKWVIKTYLDVLMDNVRNMNPFLYQQIPSMRPLTHFIYSQMKSWFWVVLILLTVAGIAFLIRDRNYLAAALLGLGYFYFTGVAGLSFMQGSRLHYPAEMCWAVLVAHTVVSFATAERHTVGRWRLWWHGRRDPAGLS